MSTHKISLVRDAVWGTQWLRHCATNRKVAGSIPDGVIEFFIVINFGPHYGLGVDSVSNRNECQEYFLGVRRPERRADNLATFMCRLS
jgi:hypothetical protein